MSINLNIIRKLIEYFSKYVLVKGMFALTVFEIFRSNLDCYHHPPNGVQRVKGLSENLSEKSKSYSTLLKIS